MAVATARAQRGPRFGSERVREALVGYGFVLIPLGLFALLYLYPIVYSFYISAHEWGGIEGNLGYVGLDNFRELARRQPVLDVAAGARDGALEHLLLRAPRRAAADGARAADGADRQRRRSGAARSSASAYYFPALTSSAAISVIAIYLLTRTGS